MEQIKAILQKIENLANAGASYSSIDKDLMLRYTRDLYETLLQLQKEPKTPILTEEPEPEVETLIPNTEKTISTSPEEQQPAPYNKDQQEPDTLFTVNSITEYGTAEDAALKESGNDISYISGQETIQKDPVEKLNFELEPELRQSNLQEPVMHSTDFRTWNKDIRSYIGINDRYNFISELFQNNNEAYEEILNELNLCDSKADALKFLENSGITTLYRWKEDGFSEQIFYNVLSQFFSSR